MRRCLLLLTTLAAMQVAAGQAWRWVDANGTVHYSDRPVPGAVEVYLPDASPASRAQTPQQGATGAPQAGGQASAPASTSTDTDAPAAYTRLAITSPTAEQTLWNLGGELSVSVDVAPALQQGHRLALIYDGTTFETPAGTGGSFTITNVYRGVHTVQAVIVDSGGTALMRSEAVPFYVQQTSVQNPNRG